MSKRLILKIIKLAFKKYACVKRILEKDNTIIIELEPYSRYEDSI